MLTKYWAICHSIKENICLTTQRLKIDINHQHNKNLKAKPNWANICDKYCSMESMYIPIRNL